MASPNYIQLTRFLMEPLVGSADHLKVSCEILGGGTRVWVRIALEGDADRGRFFGRGGRNIRAVRAILQAAAQNASQHITLEIFGGEHHGDHHGDLHEDEASADRAPRQQPEDRPRRSIAPPKPRRRDG